VVTARGDVSVCELHEPLGNLREQTFPEIWASERARALRASIAAKACHCTTEVFLWPSIVYQPVPLLKTMHGTFAWLRTRPASGPRSPAAPLAPGEAAPAGEP
jgi:hypothetical protein